ncbi:MAG: hypothetical protein ABSC89_07075 [Verrucomicrobiota bacterium]
MLHTATRLVEYEILKSIARGNKAIGVHINGIPDRYKQTKNLGPNPFDYLGVRYNIEGTKLTMIEFNGTNWVEYDEIDDSASYSVKNVAQERRGNAFKLSHFYRTYLWNKDDGYTNFSDWVG